MSEQFFGFISDLPKGCIINTDIISSNGTLICPRLTVIDDNVLKQLSHHQDMVSVKITIPDVLDNIDEKTSEDETEEEFPYVVDYPASDMEEDTSITLSDSFKESATEILTELYENIDDIDDTVKNTKEISDGIFDFITNTGSDLGINLSKLKISDEYTYKHSMDVGSMAGVLATKLGFDKNFIKDITLSGILHDIGKEKIPKDIIDKPAKLTDEEFRIVKGHPIYGYQLLSGSDNVTEEIRRGVLNHHENMDGSGYPRGLKGKDIGDMGKILTIVDVFDALVTKRSYKPKKTPAQAIEIMYTMSMKFDIEYFMAFLSVINAYPNGSIIKLSNNESGVVLRQNKSYPLRPVIRVCETDKVVDLSKDRDYLSAIIIN